MEKTMTTAKIPTGRFVWFDYIAKDLAKAQGFYGELFNWKTQPMPSPDGSTYTLITLDDQPIGGYMAPPPGAGATAHWQSSLQVADARASAAKVKALGGTILKEPGDMGGFGTFALVADPQGGAFALWQPAKADSGDYKDVAGAFCWNELVSHDPEKAVAFYTLLDFEEQRMEMPGMGTYHVLSSDGKPRAGIMKTPMPEAPEAWMPYVQVASADQTVEKAKRLGATIFLAPTDVANVGRLAVFSDPLGGWLGVLQPART
jgi:uncharacterized protein